MIARTRWAAFFTLLLVYTSLASIHALAFEKHGASWFYLTKPRVIKYSICDDGLSANAKARIKEAAALWNNGDKFKFDFDAEACSQNPNWNMCSKKHVID